VAVDAAQAGQIEHGLRQDQSVGHHHHQVGVQLRQLGLRLGGTQGLRLIDRNVVLHGELLDRAGHQLLPAPGRPIRLGVHRHHLAPGVEQGLQMLSGELRCSGKNDAHKGLVNQ